MAACGGATSTQKATLAPLPPPTATTTTALPSPTPPAVLPFSGEVPAGTYGWTSFEPHLVLQIPAGWQVGHRHRDYFDLFPAAAVGGTGPGVGFGRFDGAFGAEGMVTTTDAAALVDTLVSNPALEITGKGAAELLGLDGQAVEIRADAEQTPVFHGEGGNFNFDPGWVGQAWFLDVEGGVLLVSVFGLEAAATADISTAHEILDAVVLAVQPD